MQNPDRDIPCPLSVLFKGTGKGSHADNEAGAKRDGGTGSDESRIAMKTEEFLEELSRQKAGMEPPERTEEEKRLWEEAVQKV